MALSHDVQFWGIRIRKDRRKAYTVRWTVGGDGHSKSFVSRKLADGRRSILMQAAQRGERFDTDTGLPESEQESAGALTCFELACQYVDLKWKESAAKTRASTADALATLIPSLVADTEGRPDSREVRAALYGWAFHAERRAAGGPSIEAKRAIDWIERHSYKVADLDDPARRLTIIRSALNALASRMDGRPAAATVVARKRAVFYGMVKYAVERDILPGNPIDKVSWKAPKVADQVDRRVVASPLQVSKLLLAVRAIAPPLEAFFGAMYYTYTRPAEAVALDKDALDLPGGERSDGQWGLLLLSESAPRVGSSWTDAGEESHDRRQLKHRAKHAVRDVPIPPDQVKLLRTHLKTFGTAPDGRLFQGHRGRYVSESIYGRVWQAARKAALSPALVRSPLAHRPYDLRHAGVTLALNAGVPATEVARRAGHSVEVLLRVYAGCIDGQNDLWNGRISDALMAHDMSRPISAA